MVLSNLDRDLLQRCIHRSPQGWDEFVERFLGLVVHVVNHSALDRGVSLTPDRKEDLVADVFTCFLADDMAVLRRFAGNSSLGTYLTVVARRVVIRRLVQMKLKHENAKSLAEQSAVDPVDRVALADNIEQIEVALKKLSGNEAMAVRMFHLEGKSYSEISSKIGLPENSVGPLLSRAREKMRNTVS